MKPNVGRGDKGETDFRGKRVNKSSCNIEAVGNIDELNSFIGFIRTVNREKDIDSILSRIQNDLFALGADIATGSDRITKESVKFIEDSINKLEEELEPLSKFILPGGTQSAALLHIARGICRRAERGVVAFAKNEKLNEYTIPYLNRLSDLLFTLARVANKRAGVEEEEWKS